MKLLTLAILLISGTVTALSQTSSETLIDYHTDLYTNYLKAKEASSESEKPILMVFSGSDWCKPCIRFRAQVLNNPEFLEYARQNLIVLVLEFPAKKKNALPEEVTIENNKLAEKFNPDGRFPWVLLMSHEEEILDKFPGWQNDILSLTQRLEVAKNNNIN